jgi:glyoxylase-like metal-dependent hydrolase (beta-lactamase superfamily II)
VLNVRDNFFVVAGGGGNVGVQVGDDGVVVDAGAAASASAVVAASSASRRSRFFIIDTGPDADHVGGNRAVQAGETPFGPASGRAAPGFMGRWPPSFLPRGCFAG